MFEALLRLKWRACESLLTDDNNDAKESLQDLGEQLIVLRQEDKFFDVMDLLKSGGFDIFSKAITQCIEAGVMSTFWQSYLDMVSRLLTFLRATREGDWLLHISCVRQMLPWFFAYDRVNYSRYLSVYWWQMVRLPQTHPAAYEQLMKGEFCVQRSQSSSFAQVAVDHCIEQTMNRDSKTKGGIVGIST